ncbi:hypothetical protein COLO4_27022 [Corchorus olitorius]|uniref:Uncharacterized protein n=1 Tax=Corchorus olitorius TaxID=93759 RepID=A0A1R3HT27_9ROSI|nr:hypothetical protein COLO4_27022 [Corchorus olitorius]
MWVFFFQFDVLVDMMDARSKPPPKRRRGTKGSSSTSNDPAASANQPNNEVFVQTVRNFLDELRSCNTTTADHNCSTSNPNQG